MPDNILKLIPKKRKRGDCQHNNLFIDEEFDFVTCVDCDKDLNPVWILYRMAQEVSEHALVIDEMKRERAYLELKKRFRCNHCGTINSI